MTYLHKAILKNFEANNEFVKVIIYDKGLRIELKKDNFELPGKFITELNKYFTVVSIKKTGNIILIEINL